jgi:hypothetical protein
MAIYVVWSIQSLTRYIYIYIYIYVLTSSQAFRSVCLRLMNKCLREWMNEHCVCYTQFPLHHAWPALSLVLYTAYIIATLFVEMQMWSHLNKAPCRKKIKSNYWTNFLKDLLREFYINLFCYTKLFTCKILITLKEVHTFILALRN